MRTRAFQLILFSLGVFLIGGCGLTSDQRVSALQNAIAQTQAISQQMEAKIQQLETVIEQAKTALADPNATDATLVYLRDSLAKVEAKLAAMRPVKQVVDQNLAVLQKQLAAALAAGPLDPQKEFAAYGRGVTTVSAALPPPFNTIGLMIGSLVLPLIGGIVGAFAKGKQAKTQLAQKDGQLTVANARADEMETSLSDVVAGGEAWKSAMKAGLPEGTDPLTAWKEAMNEAQVCEVTKENVALARVRVK
jgi:small-conductance mechanosensitive channel